MDDLRYELHVYHQSKVSVFHSLPLTSANLYLHFLRCMYTTYIQAHGLQNVTLNPTVYGYEDKNGSFFPTYRINNGSESLVQKYCCKYMCSYTVHAVVLVSLAAFIANITTSPVDSV